MRDPDIIFGKECRVDRLRQVYAEHTVLQGDRLGKGRGRQTSLTEVPLDPDVIQQDTVVFFDCLSRVGIGAKAETLHQIVGRYGNSLLIDQHTVQVILKRRRGTAQFSGDDVDPMPLLRRISHIDLVPPAGAQVGKVHQTIMAVQPEQPGVVVRIADRFGIVRISRIVADEHCPKRISDDLNVAADVQLSGTHHLAEKEIRLTTSHHPQDRAMLRPVIVGAVIGLSRISEIFNIAPIVVRFYPASDVCRIAFEIIKYRIFKSVIGLRRRRYDCRRQYDCQEQK